MSGSGDAKFRALAEALPGLLFVTDAAGLNTYTNPYFSEFAGVASETLLGDGWVRHVHPDDLARAVERWNAAVGAGVLYEVEYRLRSREGLYRWFLIRGVPVRDAAGRIVEWYGVGTDIDDRKRAEARLAENSERLRLAVEAGTLGTWEVDLATRKRRWDRRFAALFGLAAPPAEVAPEDIPDYMHPDDRARAIEHFETGVRTGHLDDIEFRVVTVTGETRWVASSGVVVRDADGAGRMLGVTRDITEWRNREDALRAALDARETLVREADHRIKNSLQLVVSLLTLQRRRVLDPQASEALGSAIARVEAVAQSHRALQQSADLKTVDMGQALEELCGRLGPLAPGVRLECAFAGDLVLDAERAIPLALIVSELLTNAMRYAYPDGVGEVSVVAGVSGGVMAVSVSDRGVGYRPLEGRRGLGTSIVENLAKQIGAEVGVRSAPGAGTATEVRLAV